jgi:flagellar basal body rod protein FlgG
MPYGLYISADGASVQNRRLDVIANNLANVDTAGFKEELAVFQARYAQDILDGRVPPNAGKLADVGGGVEFFSTPTDFTPGPFKVTGIWSDVAIKGSGFFTVERDGRTALTRAGNFQLDNEGRLITQGGDPVLDETGAPIQVDLADGPVTFGSGGEVLQNGEIVATLGVVAPRSLGDLTKIGGNCFQSLGPTQPIPPGERRLATETLEVSGVEPTTQMVSMIETSRVFEANIRVMQAHDNMIGQLYGRLMRTN